MRVNFGKIFQETSKDRRMGGLVNIPSDNSLWPPAWKEIHYKTYGRFPSIKLPTPIPKNFGHETLSKRSSVRDFGILNPETKTKDYKKITQQQLSNLLYYSCGETKKSVDGKNSKRVHPSAGARYPVEVYILNFEKGELEIKCYHYNVKDHTLEILFDIPLNSRKDISKYFGYEWSVDASMAIVLTGVVNRSVMKYGERGYKYMYIEAGAILNNLQNNAMLEGVGSVIMGATNEKEIEELLDLDGEKETVIMGILLG